MVDFDYWSLVGIYLINHVKFAVNISESHFYVLVLTEDVVALIVQKMLIVIWP
jgi:sRNA-binding regulator protein Hfq